MLKRWGVRPNPVGNKSVLITMGTMSLGKQFKDLRTKSKQSAGTDEKWIERFGKLCDSYEVDQIISLKNISDEAALLLPQSQFAKNMDWYANDHRIFQGVKESLMSNHWTLSTLDNSQNKHSVDEQFLKTLLSAEAKKITISGIEVQVDKTLDLVDKTLDFSLKGGKPVMSVYDDSKSKRSFTLNNREVQWLSDLFLVETKTVAQPIRTPTPSEKQETEALIFQQPHHSCYLSEKEKLTDEAREAFLQSMQYSIMIPKKESLVKAIDEHSQDVDFVSLLAFIENGPLPAFVSHI
eukprot:Platyproteum_vivax@DN8684_c0_g1_i1.p1